jgi:hypothetical protein
MTRRSIQEIRAAQLAAQASHTIPEPELVEAPLCECGEACVDNECADSSAE